MPSDRDAPGPGVRDAGAADATREAGRVERTALGTLVAGLGWFSFLVAFLVGSLAPALVGLALVASTEAARRRLTGARLTAERTVAQRARLGDEVWVDLELAADRPVPMRVHDDVPAAFDVLDRYTVEGRGSARESALVRAVDPGQVRFRSCTVEMGDPWGFHEEVRRVPVLSRIAVAPEASWAAEGRRVGRRHTVESLVRRKHAYDEQPEVERIREYQPGDRVRDIDWTRVARVGQLFTRQRERAAPRPVIILLDARASMRWRRRVAKITTASRVAYGVAAAAEAAGVTASLVAVSEEGVTHAAGANAKRRAIAEALDRLSQLQAPVAVRHVPRAPVIEGPVTVEEKAFLESLAPFVSGPAPASAPLEAAIAQLCHRSTYPALVVAILDAETTPRLAEVAARRLKRNGHDVVVVVPATGAHHYTRAEAEGSVLDELVQARKHRERVARTLRPLKVPLVPLGPGDELDVVREVAAWAE